MSNQKENPFSRLLSIGLGLNIAKRHAVQKVNIDAELSKYLHMFSFRDYIFLEIDATFFYYTLTNQIKIKRPIEETISIANELKDFRVNDVKAVEIFQGAINLLEIANPHTIPIITKKIKKAIELSPYEEKFYSGLIAVYDSMGWYGRSKKIKAQHVKAIQLKEGSRVSKKAYAGLQKMFKSKKASITTIVERSKYGKFIEGSEGVFGIVRALTKELSAYYKGENTSITPKMIPGIVDECLKCLEWIATLADLTLFKLESNYGTNEFTAEVIESIIQLLGWKPEDLSGLQTPNFLSPTCRKKVWETTLGFDILSFSPIESIKDAVYVRIDRNSENDDPKKHAWYSKESKKEIDGSIDIGGVHAEHKDTERERISEHISEHFGEPLTIIHDRGKRIVHIDLYVIPPSKDRDYALLISSGMSERPMNAPPDARKWWRVDINSVPEEKREALNCKYAELVVKLPPDWPLPQPDGTLKEDEFLWPISELHHLITYVHRQNEWFWDGHTMRGRNEASQSFSENTKLAGWVFIFPPNLPKTFGVLKINDSKMICFLQIIPAYFEEIMYAINNGTENLIQKFVQQNIPDHIDLTRKNTCE